MCREPWSPWFGGPIPLAGGYRGRFCQRAQYRWIIPLSKSQQFATLGDHIAAQRDSILKNWSKADRADPDQTTGRSLTLGQFLDHIPEMLDAFEFRLRLRSGGADARAADVMKRDEGVKHGLHRWQQGYRLQVLINECGHLQLCLYNELDRVARRIPGSNRKLSPRRSARSWP